MTQLGIGLIGCGVMGGSLARSCNELEHAQVVALADVVDESADKLADELGTFRFKTNNYRELPRRQGRGGDCAGRLSVGGDGRDDFDVILSDSEGSRVTFRRFFAALRMTHVSVSIG